MGRALAVLSFATFAIALAACGGGSGSSAVPTTGNTGPTQTQPQPATSKIALLIPAHLRHSSVHGHYVSPGTESLVLSVTPISASSPAPSPLPTQIFTVATPSPCAALQNGDLECGFTATVIPGSDKFKLTTYSGTGGTGSALSTYTATAAIPTPNPQGTVPPLSFTLEGIPASVTFTFTNADPSGANVAAPPIGVATSEPFTASVLDASGYTIMEQTPSPTATAVPFASSFTISLSPTGDGVTLANGTTSGSSLTIKSPADLNGLTLNYDGSIHGIGSSLVSTFTLSSSLVNGTTTTTTIHRATVTPSRRRPHAPSPTEGALMLAGNLIETPIVQTGDDLYAAGLTYAAGKFGFTAYDTSSEGSYAGTFSPSIAAPNSSVYPPLTAGVSDSTYDKYGDVWLTDTNNSGSVDCVPPSGTPTIIPLTSFTGLPTTSQYTPWGIVEDTASTLWFSVGASSDGSYGVGIASISSVGANCSYSTANENAGLGPNLTDNPDPYAMALDPSGIGAWTSDTNNGGIYKASSPGSLTPYLGDTGMSYLGSQSNGTLYGIETGYGSSNLYSITPSSGSVNPIGSSFPFGYLASGPMNVASDGTLLFWVDDYDNVTTSALYNASTGLNTLIAFNDTDYDDSCSGAFDGNQTPWFLCGVQTGGANAYELVLTPTWTVLGGTSVAQSICPFGTASYLLDILPPYGVTNTAFTATPAQGDTLISVGSSDSPNAFDLTLNPPSTSPTQAVVDVSDGTRTVPVTFTLNQSTNCGSARHAHRKHRRHALRPH